VGATGYVPSSAAPVEVWQWDGADWLLLGATGWDGETAGQRWTDLQGFPGVEGAQAQVGEVNEALNRARLRIDEMRPGNHSLVLVAAGSGMAAGELDQAAQRLQATGVFDRVMRLAAPVRAGIATQAVASVAAVDTVWDTDAAQCSDE
jgi:hypothetical protein